MTLPRIRLLHPAPSVADPSDVDGLGIAELIDLYGPADRSTPRVRANFVSSVDGSAAAGGLSGALGGPADRLVFDLLRRLCDVVVVGAGTVRDEGYGAMRLDDDAVRWRTSLGLPAHPVFAVVSANLRLDSTDDLFADAPVRPLVLTSESAPREARARLDAVADVVTCGPDRVDPRLLVDTLVDRGLSQIHTEGGPTLLGDLIEADVLDELCLTVSPTLEGGLGPRISTTRGDVELRPLRLDHVLLSADMLLTKYSRRR